MTQLSLHSPVGELTISEEDGVIVSVDWGWSPFQEENELLLRAKKMLDDYFDGEEVEFDLPLKPHGTEFQKNVWKIMSEIPYGQILTYGEISDRLNSHARAVGLACGANPIPIIIPCHRVMGKNGKLTGFSGGEGISTKRYLLELEDTFNNLDDNLSLPF
ncbi:methylated-DNA--[protein]-cysteine S-methyltransferase [Pseudemcibacter aquimaris]|uniref:methylated-DNA--[protein]-cysteine S-methyltransferase n=1 Tax=Pseudemcibacter aquimaris TaxID=2857064 RepID=UPI002013818E|nr:methylated-DNA--[protein]-cysteine S-methyltransferase [Pseudemcibacter aquimaris]MCC3861834.1 methylated-DNA--[protein]-cysteine S-methyltransferase [Pseudemcibacter aquimaris]WDU58589.1 methylated-DNA--[protein]-cysteine S-methyltransferase [Pseudemcibacter aquimaris]